MKEIRLINKEQKVIRAIELVNGNFASLHDALAAIPEVQNIDLDLLCRFEKGLTIPQYFEELAEGYIASCTPAPLGSMKEAIKKDFADRAQTNQQLYDVLATAKGILSHFSYETNEEVDLSRKGASYAISDNQERRLLEGCKVKPTKLQSEYLNLLDALTAAKEAVRAFEDKNSVNAAIGARYMLNPACMESLLDSVK